MKGRARLVLFLVSAPFAVWMFLRGMLFLPPVGAQHGRYGDVLNARVVPERHTTDTVTAVNYDYRAFDTLIEEYTLFGAVLGVALLLREKHPERGQGRGDNEGDDRQKQNEKEQELHDEGAHEPASSDAVRGLAAGLTGLTVIYGLYLASHGQVSPGGGFQAGVVLATAALVVFVAAEAKTFLRIAPHGLVRLGEAAGAGGYILVGMTALFFGRPWWTNVLPLGNTGRIDAAGAIALLSPLVALAVAGGLVVVLLSFVQRNLQHRAKEGR